MNSEVVFGIMVVFLCADFLAERILERLNRRAMSPKLPDRLRGIYDEQEYALNKPFGARLANKF